LAGRSGGGGGGWWWWWRSQALFVDKREPRQERLAPDDGGVFKSGRDHPSELSLCLVFV